MLKIGIVEDDFRVASIHEDFLSKVADIDVVFKALNAEETLKKLKEHTVDLVLLDIYMPDRLGIDIIEEIKNLQPDVGIIIISAGTDKKIVQQALQKGVFDYIIKPVSMKRFTDTIEKFKRVKEELEQKEEVDQTFLDQYFGHVSDSSKPEQEMPKGIDPLTLKKVVDILKTYDGITAEKMGVEMGASRTTARRYLEYLISIGQCYAELEYGIVGRPERKYFRKEEVI
ncbi:MAG: response regulator [Bacillaceae bacterium]|nr:response regulator [Bacillaceae bacterium]